jgi:hypothetical protein
MAAEGLRDTAPEEAIRLETQAERYVQRLRDSLGRGL